MSLSIELVGQLEDLSATTGGESSCASSLLGVVFSFLAGRGGTNFE